MRLSIYFDLPGAAKSREKREQSWVDHRGPSSAISMLVEAGLFLRNSADLDLPFEKVFRY